MFKNCLYQRFFDKNTPASAEQESFEKVKDWDKCLHMILPPTIAIIDIDNEQDADRLINICRNEKIKTYILKTTRGAHFYFSNNDVNFPKVVNAQNWIGLFFDSLTGYKNLHGIVKLNGKWREWVSGFSPQTDILNDGDIDVIPVWLHKSNMSNLVIKNVGDGEGRNDKLNKIKTAMIANNYTIDDVGKTLEIINKYIFLQPLSENELSTLKAHNHFTLTLEEKAKNKEKKEKEKNLREINFGDFTRGFINEHKIYVEDLIYHKKLWIYNGTKWTNDDSFIESEIIKKNEYLMRFDRIELISRIKSFAFNNLNEKPKPLDGVFPCKNGLYNIFTNEITDFSQEYFYTNIFDIIYDEKANDFFLLKTLIEILGENQITSFIECVAYTLFDYNCNLKYMFQICDFNNLSYNGKSTLINFIQRLLTDINNIKIYSTLSMKKIDEVNYKFELSSLNNVFANFDNEGSKKPLNHSCIETIKNITSPNNKISFAYKGKDGSVEHFRCKLWVAVNGVLKSENKNDDWLNRQIIFNLTNQFKPGMDNFIPDIYEMITTKECLSTMFNLCTKAYKNILKKKDIYISDYQKENKKKYEEINNDVINWIKDKNIIVDNIKKVSPIVIYALYKDWNNSNSDISDRFNFDDFKTWICNYFNVRISNNCFN